MIRVFASYVLVVALLPSLSARAADDPGLMLHDVNPGGRHVGVALQLSASIPLEGVGRQSTRPQPRLSLRAGPSVTRTGALISPRTRTTVAPLTELSLRPGHSITWSLAGHPFSVSYSQRALREQADAEQSSEHRNLSTIGAVAIGVGIAAIVGAVILVERIEAASD